MEAMKMRLKLFIKTFIVRFMTSNEAIFSISVEQQKKYLENFMLQIMILIEVFISTNAK